MPTCRPTIWRRTGWRGRRSRRRRWSRASRPTARRRIPHAATARSGSKSCLRHSAPELPRGFRCRAGSRRADHRAQPYLAADHREAPPAARHDLAGGARSCEAGPAIRRGRSMEQVVVVEEQHPIASVAAQARVARAARSARNVVAHDPHASGNSAATMSRVPSVDASSTTSSSMSGQVCARRCAAPGAAIPPIAGGHDDRDLVAQGALASPGRAGGRDWSAATTGASRITAVATGRATDSVDHARSAIRRVPMLLNLP